MKHFGFPEAQGLYSPENEHDNCGIGFVANIKGQPSHEIIRRGLDVLLNMDHRGAISADNSSGDGAGILLQIPHEFITEELKIPVGNPGTYGTGLIFLPKDESEAGICLDVLSNHIKNEGLTLGSIS
jgi:glutamate synthase (NADPH) large chain